MGNRNAQLIEDPNLDNCFSDEINASITPCANGGRCFAKGEQQYCSCSDEYSGLFCEKEKNYCARNPCYGKSKCTNGGSSFQCECETYRVGTQCENILDPCESFNPCKNVSLCYPNENQPVCVNNDEIEAAERLIQSLLQQDDDSPEDIISLVNAMSLNAVSRELLLYRMATKSRREIESISYSLRELVLRCTYEGVLCEDSQWHPIVHPRFGMCYTFNAFQHNKSIAMRPGKYAGLEIEVSVMPDSYISTTMNMGAVVTIETSEIHPLPEILGMKVSPGLSYDMALTYTSKLKMESPYGNCIPYTSQLTSDNYYYDGIYSLWGCEFTNLQKITNHSCLCCNPKYAVFSNCPICEITDVCHKEIESNFTKMKTTCVQSCKTEHYHPVVTQYTPLFCDVCPSEGVLRMSVFYERLQYVEIAEVPSIMVVDLLSKFGSYMGLLLGMSVISILEILIVISDVFISKFSC